MNPLQRFLSSHRRRLVLHHHFLLLLILIQNSIDLIGAPPVVEKKQKKEEELEGVQEHEQAYGVHYEKYLREIVQTLEKDDYFRSKIEKANPDDIKTGKIAEELDYLNDTIRTMLDEIKRNEIERLRQARHDLDTGVDHVDHTNLDTFEIEDLKKLIVKATKDLDEIDAKRRHDYKTYEMEKEFERRQKLRQMTPEERQRAELEYQKQQRKHAEHEKVKHPGSEDQLKDVWEAKDQLPRESFDLETFFNLHDLNGDGYLDFEETEALFNKELDKVYNSSQPEDDMRQREEDKNRMREHVIKELDQNHDGLLSKDEIFESTKEPDYKKDPGWKTVDEQQTFAEAEYLDFERMKLKELGVQAAPAMSPLGVHPADSSQQGHPQQQQHPPAAAQQPKQAVDLQQVVEGQAQQQPQGVPPIVAQGHPQAAADQQHLQSNQI